MLLHRGRPSSRLIIALCCVFVVGLGVATERAAAGTYIVDACQRPDGAPVGTDGWTPSNMGAFTYYGDGCAGGGALTAELDSGLEHQYRSHARWSFAAPPNTRISGLDAMRSAQVGPDRPYGTPVAMVKTEADYVETCSRYSGCSGVDGRLFRQLSGSGSLSFGVECGGAEGGQCGPGTTRTAVRQMRVSLSDDSSPTISALSGSLTSPTTLTQIRSLNYSASDLGGGVYRQRLLVDGVEKVSSAVDENGGKCVRYGNGGGFAHRVPCKLNASGSLSFDTTALTDGAHEVALEVYDATATNKVVSGPWTITVGRIAPTGGVGGGSAVGPTGNPANAATSTAGVPGALGSFAVAAAATPTCSTATVRSFNRATTLTRSYARSSVPLAGRLVGTSGEAKAGRVLDVVQTVMRAGTAQRTTVGSVRTGPDGGFRVTAPSGPSRALQVVDAGCGAVGPVITQRVRGAIQAKTTTRRVRNRQTARISGRVLGGHLGRGIPLELQVKVGRQWRDVKHTMTDTRGRFRVGYRFMRTYVRYTYRFRVVTRAGGAWPYMPATSRVVKVRVN